MVMGLGVPVIFPSLGSMIWPSLPSTGSPRVGSPASAVPRSAPPPCRPSRRASLPSLGGTAPVLVFRSRGSRAPRPRAGASLPGCPSRTFGTETTRVPRFLGKSRCVHAPLSDPGELFTPGLSRRVDAAFRWTNDVGTRGYFPLGAQSRGLPAPCVRFAGRITPPPRNTRFRLVASLCRAGLVTRWTPFERFPRSLTSLPPLPGFAWRTGSRKRIGTA